MWLFVDFDGTLVDSLNVARSVYDRFVVDCGGQPDDAEFRSLNGPSLSEIVDRIADRLGIKDDRTQLLGRYENLWTSGYQSVLPKPGALGLLREARIRGLQTAIVTSAGARFVADYLSRVDWTALIDQTISGDQVARSKPDPEIYQRALLQTGARPMVVRALEDSVNGVRAAVGAGISTVGFCDGSSHSQSSEQLRAAGASRVIGRLNEFFAEGMS
jgi:HAD superfamily hydrolase (TIGR01509 family)